MEENTNEVVNQEPIQEPEKKLGKKVVGAILITALFVVVMSVVFFRGISVKDTRNDSESNSTVNGVRTEQQEVSKNGVNDTSKSGQNSPSFDGSDSSGGDSSNSIEKEGSEVTDSTSSQEGTSSREESNTPDTPDGAKEVTEEEPKEPVVSERKETSESSNNTESTPDSFIAVDNLNLGESIKGTALVLNKCSYLFKSSYVYCVEVVLVVDGGESQTVQYMCPLRTYEVLEVGTTVNIEYQMDENNVISIYSLSK